MRSAPLPISDSGNSFPDKAIRAARATGGFSNMSSTTIRYRDAEFVGNDLPIEAWMLEVACQMDADAGTDAWLDELREDWRLQATSGFGFGPSPALDKFVDSDGRRERLAGYFRKALKAISLRGSVIAPDELARSGIGGDQAVYTRGLPTQMVTEVGEQFLALIS